MYKMPKKPVITGGSTKNGNRFFYTNKKTNRNKTIQKEDV